MTFSTGGRPLVSYERALAEVVRLRTAQRVPNAADSPQTSVQFELVRRWANRPRGPRQP
jgi:hypothetical protein